MVFITRENASLATLVHSTRKMVPIKNPESSFPIIIVCHPA